MYYFTLLKKLLFFRFLTRNLNYFDLHFPSLLSIIKLFGMSFLSKLLAWNFTLQFLSPNHLSNSSFSSVSLKVHSHAFCISIWHQKFIFRIDFTMCIYIYFSPSHFSTVNTDNHRFHNRFSIQLREAIILAKIRGNAKPIKGGFVIVLLPPPKLLCRPNYSHPARPKVKFSRPNNVKSYRFRYNSSRK